MESEEELVDLKGMGIEIDPLSADSLRARLRDILNKADIDPDTQMRAIVTAVTKLGIDIGVRKTKLPYPLSRADRMDRFKVLLGSISSSERNELFLHLKAERAKATPTLEPATPLPSS